MFTTTAVMHNPSTSQATWPRYSAKSSRIEPFMLHGRFQAFAKIATVLLLLHKTCCKKPSLSYYHHVVYAALPQFLPWFYYQFSAISTSIIHPIKQSHNVVYSEATDLLVARKPIPSFLCRSNNPESILTDSTTARYISRHANFKGYY